MYTSQIQIAVKARPREVFSILSDLSRLPEWYVPSEAITPLSQEPVGVGWQFHLHVRTLGGFLLKALGTVNDFRPQDYAIARLRSSLAD